MPYASLQDLEKAAGGNARLVALSDFDGDNVPDAGVTDDAIAEADAEINTYANKRFAVPFAPVPEAIRRKSARIAVYYLALNRRMLTTADQARYDADVKWLEGLRDGANLPGIEPIPGKSSIVTDVAGERDTAKDVSREKTKGFW